MSAKPKYATPLNPARPNLLPQCRVVAELIGLSPLLPWQEHLLALMTEYEEGNPEDGIVPFYNQVVFSIPRQTGKTEVICTCSVCLRFLGLYAGDEPPHMVYAAQTQSDALAVWESKIVRRLSSCGWGQKMGFHWTSSPNDPHLRIGGKSDRSGKGRFGQGKVRIIANKSGSGLGMTSDLVFLDEARQYGDESREADLVPQMNTRPSPQLVVASTMGGPFSPYFNRKVDAGRVLATEQAAGKAGHLRRAYVEYGVGAVGSDDYDASDPKVWAEAHPMLGLCNWTTERMADEYDRCLAEGNLEMFRNNFLNQRLAADDAPAIPLDLIYPAEVPKYSADDLGDWQVLALSSDPDDKYLSAAVCGADRIRVVRPAYDEAVGDLVRTETTKAARWVADYLEDKPYIRQVVYSEGSEIQGMIDGFRKPGVWVGATSIKDYKTQCLGLLAGFSNEEAGIEASSFFRDAVISAEQQTGAFGRGWLWRKKKDVNDNIGPLVAVTLAYGSWSAKKARPEIRIY